jgi:predicted DCC family thiol-disulfide oxidoreductase YuxK
MEDDRIHGHRLQLIIEAGKRAREEQAALELLYSLRDGRRTLRWRTAPY